MVALSNHCWTYCQFNDRKYLRKKITRTDLETRILKTSLKEQYAKLGGKEANAIETTPKDSIKITWLTLPRP
jgi:penicillin-binding protein 2